MAIIGGIPHFQTNPFLHKSKALRVSTRSHCPEWTCRNDHPGFFGTSHHTSEPSSWATSRDFFRISVRPLKWIFSSLLRAKLSEHAWIVNGNIEVEHVLNVSGSILDQKREGKHAQLQCMQQAFAWDIDKHLSLSVTHGRAIGLYDWSSSTGVASCLRGAHFFK